MRSGPPGRGVGGKSRMGQPHGPRIAPQIVQVGDLVRVPVALEHRHVLAAGDAEGLGDPLVDMLDQFHQVILFPEVARPPPFPGMGNVGEVAPHHRIGGRDGRAFAKEYLLVVQDVQASVEEILDGLFSLLVVEEELQAVLVPPLREQPVAGVAGPQAVLPLLHDGEHPGDAVPVDPPSLQGDAGSYAAAPELALPSRRSAGGVVLSLHWHSQPVGPDLPVLSVVHRWYAPSALP